MRRLVWLLAAVLLGIGVALAAPARRTVGRCLQPQIYVVKHTGVLELRCQDEPPQRFAVTFGKNPLGKKERQGDERTPEGSYHVTSRLRSARFHRFLGISYPNAEDLAGARARGIADPGGGIGIHGTRVSLAAMARAWIRFAHATGMQGSWGPTDGCIALANEDVAAVFDQVTVGTPVVITP
jgi:murein L,D-transpeptidase YafK